MTKKLTVTLFVISILGFASAFILKNSTELGLCLVSEPTCINTLTDTGEALFYAMGALALVFLILLFVPRAFSVWWKFAIWYVPLAIFIFATIPPPSHSWIFPGVDPSFVYQWVSGIYVVISLIVIGLASSKKKTA